MKIAVIGSGYVGLVSGACFAQIGHHVICVDQNEEKIKSLNSGVIPIYEPGLDKVVEGAAKLGTLKFTTDLVSALKDADSVFIAVGTPTDDKTGHADLTYVFDAGREIARHLQKYILVVIKSTVPVGTARKLREAMLAENPAAKFDIASNPEFLREGSAIDDFMKPDRIVVGVRSEKAEDVMRAIYKPLTDQNAPILFTTSESAELIKYAANCYLAMRIGFVNQISDLCEVVGADIAEVSKGAGLDKRIGTHYFAPGPGFGGSCFPKDTRALVAIAQDAGSPISIIEDVIRANEQRRESIALKVAKHLNGNVKGKKIAVFGIAFKADTDDLRDAASLTVIPALQAMGAEISAYDPIAMEHGQKFFNDVTWAETALSAAEGADAVVILTEWKEFLSIDFTKLRSSMINPLVIDFRNLYQPKTMIEHGINYVSIGRSLSPLTQ
jgi:UDPglucose 6-dehydrogenase